MPTTPTPHTERRPRLRAAHLAVALTAAACLLALLYRTPLRSRYWAWCLERVAEPAQQALYLTQLCNAGDQGRWGAESLRASASPQSRQFAALILQHSRADWSRTALIELLADADAGVRELAAVALAARQDEGVLPALRAMYRSGESGAASAACVALERLGTSAAIAALSEFAAEPAGVECRAALIDALDGVGRPTCVPALLNLLDDPRVIERPSRRQQFAERVLAGAALFPAHATPEPASAPTIGGRAAAALARITGIPAVHSAGSAAVLPAPAGEPDPGNAGLRAAWRTWYEQHGGP